MSTYKPFYDYDIIVILATEEDHTQMKGNSWAECSIVNQSPISSKASTGNPYIVLNIQNNDSCLTYCVPLCVESDF